MTRSVSVQSALRCTSVLAVAALLSWGVPAVAADAQRDAALRRGAAAYADLERQTVEKLATALDALVSDPALVQAFRARDREKLLAIARPRFAKLAGENITHWYFHEPEPARTCFLRVHSPVLHGDVVERQTLSQAIASHQIGYGKELGRTAFAVRVVKPVRSGNTVIGYMELGEEINRFLERIKAQTGDDFGLLVDKNRVDRKELARVRGEDRWDDRPDVVLIDSTVWNDRHVELPMSLAELPADGTFVSEWREGTRVFAGGAFPVRDAGNQIVGALFVRHAMQAP